jgi:hypothetical protein
MQSFLCKCKVIACDGASTYKTADPELVLHTCLFWPGLQGIDLVIIVKIYCEQLAQNIIGSVKFASSLVYTIISFMCIINVYFEIIYDCVVWGIRAPFNF